MQAAGAPCSGDDSRPCLLHRLVLYQRGAYAPLLHLIDADTGIGDTLPLMKLINAHIVASEKEHPKNLLRVGGQFAALGMWFFSLRAYGQAKAIYLKRRAPGNVQYCNAKLDVVRENLLVSAPWLCKTDLPVETPIRLTNREKEAATLVALGLTNRQIAERLGCTVRTVESHVASARAKLGATDRKELARLLPRWSRQ